MADDDFDKRIKAESKPTAIIKQMIKDKFSPPAKTASAEPSMTGAGPGRDKTLNDAEAKALGYKRGGLVSANYGYRPMTSTMQRKRGGKC
jgi:hypothetical protein